MEKRARDAILEEAWRKFLHNEMSIQEAFEYVWAAAMRYREDFPQGCNCEIRDRAWNPLTERCDTCGRRFVIKVG